MMMKKRNLFLFAIFLSSFFHFFAAERRIKPLSRWWGKNCLVFHDFEHNRKHYRGRDELFPEEVAALERGLDLLRVDIPYCEEGRCKVKGDCIQKLIHCQNYALLKQFIINHDDTKVLSFWLLPKFKHFFVEQKEEASKE